MTIDNIIEIKNKSIDSYITVVKKPNTCFHMFVIDEQKREISCSKCPKLFDAIEAMLIVAREWDVYDANRKRIKEDYDKKSIELINLKKQIINAKSTLKRIFKND